MWTLSASGPGRGPRSLQSAGRAFLAGTRETALASFPKARTAGLPRTSHQVEVFLSIRRWRLSVAVTAIAVGIGAGLWALGRTPEQPPGGPVVEATWRGLWPQNSREEGERAQAAADAGDPSHSWQAGSDGDEVVLRYVREELGWARPRALDIRISEDAEAWLRSWRLIRCTPGAVNPDYPEIVCAPPEGGNYPAVFVTVGRLLRHDEGALWIVTGVESAVVHQPEPVSQREVRKFAAAFLERRIRGSGAEEYLSPEGREEFGAEFGETPLYSPASGPRYVRYDIVFVDGPLWPFGSFEVGARMVLSSGGNLEDTLFVGPGGQPRW